MEQRIRCLGLSVLAACFLAGCIFIPIPLTPSGDLLTTENDIQDLVDNGASKTEVIGKLGDPLKYRKTSMSYSACREPAGVGLLLFIVANNGDYIAGTPEIRGERQCFELLLDFDLDNHLTGYQEIPWQYDFNLEQETRMLMRLADQDDAIAKRLWEQSRTYKSLERKSQEESSLEVTTKLAEAGDPKAMYQVYLTMYDLYIEPRAAWTWLCKAADKGHENTRIEVAYWHRKSNWGLAESSRITWLRNAPVHADDRIAYLWYTLAANGNEKRLRIRNDLFMETLSRKEVTEANIMVRSWKPGQCERELTEETEK